MVMLDTIDTLEPIVIVRNQMKWELDFSAVSNYAINNQLVLTITDVPCDIEETRQMRCSSGLYCIRETGTAATCGCPEGSVKQEDLYCRGRST